MTDPLLKPEHTQTASSSQPAAQVISLEELHPEQAGGRAAHQPVVDSYNPLHAVKLSLQVCVGEVQLTVGEFLEAHENQVLVLNRGVEQPIDLLLEGKVVARGQLVAVDGSFAVRITELPLPLKV